MASPFWIFLGVVCVVAILADSIVKIIRAAKTSGGKVADRISDLEDDLHGLEQDLAEARKRIEVLEKIVTDQSYDLGREIDDLASN